MSETDKPPHPDGVMHNVNNPVISFDGGMDFGKATGSWPEKDIKRRHVQCVKSSLNSLQPAHATVPPVTNDNWLQLEKMLKIYAQ